MFHSTSHNIPHSSMMYIHIMQGAHLLQSDILGEKMCSYLLGEICQLYLLEGRLWVCLANVLQNID